MVLHAQLSFIQLGGGIAVGVHAEEVKFYTLLNASQNVVQVGASTVVCILLQIFF
jgi:hypothetical protein